MRENNGFAENCRLALQRIQKFVVAATFVRWTFEPGVGLHGDHDRFASIGLGPIKPLAVRLNESTRTQLDIIAQLNDRTVTDEVRLAVEAWIDKTKADPAIQRRAQDVRDEIEREAAGKRDAIAAIFDAIPAPKSPRAKAPTA